MRKYFSALTSMLISALLCAATVQSQKKLESGTYFIFVGPSYSFYYVANGWKVYSPSTDDLCIGIIYPQLVWHPNITTTFGVASALWAANQGTIYADLAYSNFTVETYCDEI